MGIDYQIVCMDCGELLNIGKRYMQEDPPKWPVYWKFNFFNMSEPKQNYNLRFVSHFLMRHLNHELRVFSQRSTPDPPESNEMTVPDGEYIEDISEFYSHSVRIVPADDELDEMVPEVLERLAELRRGEKLHDPLKPYNENPRYKR